MHVTFQSGWGRAAFALFLGASVLLAACGGGGGGGSEAVTPPKPVPPAVTAQPASLSVPAGSSATFAVTATGDAPLAYQWLRNGAEIAGSTQASYTVGAVAMADTGSRFSVRVSNAAGSVSSAEAALTVTPAPIPNGISLAAGIMDRKGALDGVGSAALFNNPNALAFDASGVLYVNDDGNRTIRRVTRDGTVSTIAGTAGLASSTEANEALATIKTVPGSDGGLYLGVFGRFVSAAGVVTQIALPTTPYLSHFSAAPDGTFYGASSTAVYRIDLSTQPSTAVLIAGLPGNMGTTDGRGADVRFFDIGRILADGAGNIYVSEPRMHMIRKIAPDGTVTTLAGQANVQGIVDGKGAAARLSYPVNMALDAAGTLWVADTGSGRFRRISPAGDVTTPFGIDRSLFPAYEVPMAFGPEGDLYFSAGYGVQRVNAAGVVSTFVGQDGPAPAANAITNIGGLAVDPAGNIVVARVDSQAAFQLGKYSPNGERLAFQVSVPTPSFNIITPLDVFYATVGADAQGNLWVANPTTVGLGSINTVAAVGGTVNRVAPDGTVTSLLSWGVGSAGAIAPAFPAIGRDNMLYFVDLMTNNLMRWNPVTGLAVLANLGPSEPTFFLTPWFIAADAAGQVYVIKNAVLQRVDKGALVTVAGMNVPGDQRSVDGTGTQARFSRASAMVADTAGNLYVADYHLIRKVTPAGVVTTVAGQRGSVGLRLGALPGSLGELGAMSIGPDGVLHVMSGSALVNIRF
ncbi:hypothetical protein ACFPOE_00210 [Caenimonas terrae]|uniref:Ig-like domain-containing protein n=1 Tax=Caenimonas terrae TaxID=696074 RepID=A0ABW0N8S7_9BURK